MNEEIFKIQFPLFTNTRPAAMIYNFDRSKTYTVPVTDELKKFMDGKPKKFAWGFMTEENFWIKEEAPWQDW